MFKPAKENANIFVQSIDFINRQLAVLRETARRYETLEPKIVADQIGESVTLI